MFLWSLASLNSNWIALAIEAATNFSNNKYLNRILYLYNTENWYHASQPHVIYLYHICLLQRHANMWFNACDVYASWRVQNEWRDLLHISSVSPKQIVSIQYPQPTACIQTYSFASKKLSILYVNYYITLHKIGEFQLYMPHNELLISAGQNLPFQSPLTDKRPLSPIRTGLNWTL